MRLVLEARGIAKQFGDHVVLDGLDLQVRRGECVALIGENGAGKTTMLRVCAGMLRPDAGTLRCHGDVGYCPQEPGIVDLLSVDDHFVLFGAPAGLSRQAAIRHGRTLLAAFGLRGAGATLARDLSGGSRQKLNLALALLGDPDLLLLDEPYQGFDHGSYVDFWRHVEDWRSDGRAIVVVTHLLTELQRVDRVVELRVERGPREADVAEVPA